VLQWVALRGVVSSVRTITASIWASVIRRGAPGRAGPRLVEQPRHPVPDEAVPPFPDGGRRLEDHDLRTQLFAAVGALLEAKGLFVRSGTIVDATIIDAPSSTKNATKTRDPAMRQTKKGNHWYFGMKIHIGTDTQGLVHSLCTTNAAAADITQLGHLLHGTERTLYGDKAYWTDDDRRLWTDEGRCYRVQRRGKNLSSRWERLNVARSRIRAMVEHPFLVVKRLWGFTKVRCRGLAKNTARAYTAFALAQSLPGPAPIVTDLSPSRSGSGIRRLATRRPPEELPAPTPIADRTGPRRNAALGAIDQRSLAGIADPLPPA
jgi:IS5 family transposase